MQWVHLAGLVLAIAGMATIDWRYKLAFSRDAKRAGFTIGCAIAFFVVWDLLGIALGIFMHGTSPYQLAFTIVPQFPLEELFFLGLLSYCTLVIYNGASVWRSRI